MKFLALALTAASLLVAGVKSAIVTYDRPSIYPKSGHFGLRVNGTDIPTVSYAKYDYAHFSMSEGQNMEFRIRTVSQGSIKKYTITPQALPIKSRVEGNQLIFSVLKVHYLIIKIDDMKEFVVLADPIETDVPKLGSSGVFNVLDYKADNTGKAITSGIQSAVDAAGKKPGSVVYVPKGLYLVGNIVLPTQTSLYLAGGAVLRFTGKPSDYKKMYKKSDLFDGTWWITTATNSTDIKLYGRGTIDGNGHYTRTQKYMASLVVPAGTKNFVMDGVLVRDSSFWAVNVVQIDGGTFSNFKVLDRFDVSQNDGIDINESNHIRVRRGIAIANDDSFSAKTWLAKTGTTVPYPYPPRSSSDIMFDDCLAWTMCFGFKVGEGSYQTQDRITFQNSYVYRAGVGIGIHHKFGNATMSNIRFENIDIESLRGAPAGQAAWGSFYVNDVSKGIGHITGLTVKNIRARMIGAKKGLIQGQGESAYISNVTFSDVFIWANTTGAKTTAAMNLNPTKFYKDIRVVNSK